MQSTAEGARRSQHRGLVKYFSNCSDPGYKSAEWSFVASYVLGPKYKKYLDKAMQERKRFLQDPTIPSLYKVSPAHFYEIKIIKCLDRLPDGTTKSRDDVGPIIVEVLRRYGMDAIRLAGLKLFKIAGKRKIIRYVEETLHPLALRAERAERAELKNLDRLGGWVCGVIRQWQEQALRGDFEERRKSGKWLRAIFDCLIPSAVGKRKKRVGASAFEVQEFYYRELFRLLHIRHALRSSDGPRNHHLRIKKVSKDFNFPLEAMREFLDLDENNEPKDKIFIVTPKEMARRLTARNFQIASQVVSNRLSS
ncbi:MAG: hypothetical protein ACREQ2_04910 [Candidatus Binatia bacterium]